MKKAFTLIETSMVIIVVGFLLALTIMNITNIMPDTDKAKAKKAYANVESAISRLLNNAIIYPSDDGFLNTHAITIKGTGETIGFNGPYSKFREALIYELNVMKNDIPCELYEGTFSSTQCFLNDDGVVYGVPDSDFVSFGIMNNPSFGNLVPIVLYPEWDENKTLENDAFIIGVRFDGNIRVLNTISCNDNSEQMQCKFVDYLKSNSIKLD